MSVAMTGTMRKRKKLKIPKLSVNKTSVRRLDRDELDGVRGGLIRDTEDNYEPPPPPPPPDAPPPDAGPVCPTGWLCCKIQHNQSQRRS